MAHIYGGFEFAHLYFEQGLIATEQFIGHIQENSMTGQQLQILLSQIQLVSGSATKYLEDMTRNFDYILVTHMTVMQNFLKKCKAKI
eukprot:12082312-Ditylum_brightwellii.AAC.2